MPETKDPQELLRSKDWRESKRLKAVAAALLLTCVIQATLLLIIYLLPSLTTAATEAANSTIQGIKELTAVYVLGETGTSLLRQNNINTLFKVSSPTINQPASDPPTSQPTVAESLLTGTQSTQSTQSTQPQTPQTTTSPDPTYLSPEDRTPISEFENNKIQPTNSSQNSFTSPAGWNSSPSPSLDLSSLGDPIEPAEAEEFPDSTPENNKWPEQGVPTE